VSAIATLVARDAAAKACWATADDIDSGVVVECADASVMELDGGGGAEPPPPTWPQPPIPEPIDVECESCKTAPTVDKLPALPIPPFMWNREMEKLCGPGQTLGISFTPELEGSITKAPCSCYEKTHINVGVGGSLQLCKYGGELSGRWEETSVSCQTPECSEDTGAFSCKEPTGTHKSKNWSLRGGLNFQIPWEALAPSVCGYKVVNCNGEIGFSVGASGSKDAAEGKGYCGACEGGLDLNGFGVNGRIVGRGEIEVNVYLASAVIGVEIEGGVRYRQMKGNNCGESVDQNNTCFWLRSKIYGAACLMGFLCIDSERPLFAFGEECRLDMPPGQKLPPPAP